MAFLIDVNSGQRLFLYAHHSFGRLPYAVDTVLPQAQISKHHAVIEWLDNTWFIRDLSRNGTWINYIRLTENTRHRLHQGDKIYFADHHNPAFTVDSLEPPGDVLMAHNEAARLVAECIPLHQYHLLPDEAQPELVLYANAVDQQWFVEQLDDGYATVLNEQDTVNVGEQVWQLKTSHLQAVTEQSEDGQYQLAQLQFIFELSADEEQTRLQVVTAEKVVEMRARSHHYLTLNLARYRSADAAKGIEPQEQGWVYPEQLVKDLGLDIAHVNIQIHRVRKQLADALNVFDAQRVIERRSGKVRFGGCCFEIHKGGQLECQLPSA